MLFVRCDRAAETASVCRQSRGPLPQPPRRHRHAVAMTTARRTTARVITWRRPATPSASAEETRGQRRRRRRRRTAPSWWPVATSWPACTEHAVSTSLPLQLMLTTTTGMRMLRQQDTATWRGLPCDRGCYPAPVIDKTTITSCAEGRHNIPRPCKLTFDLLTLKLVSKSRVTWATSMPILVFLGLSVLDFGPTYTRQTDVRRQTSGASSPNAPYRRGGA